MLLAKRRRFDQKWPEQGWELDVPQLVPHRDRRFEPAAASVRDIRPGSPEASSGAETGEIAEGLLRDGYAVLNGLFAETAVEQARRCVLENSSLLRNTRPNPSAGHLAGFHRYPALEHLHAMLSTQPGVLDVLKKATGSAFMQSIGLSDITVNRSQEWHVDLLRGKYRHHLNSRICWGADGGGVYKVLLYLQSGQSLRIVPGAHIKAVDLDSDRKSEPEDPSEVTTVNVTAGAVILMDIRLPHRGSSERELSNGDFLASPKILISTVLGGESRPLTAAMEKGNFERLLDWDTRHREQGRIPQLPLN
ncbi:MAG TPA: hypothetical protein VF662_16155 [Allosphingosinicella sp.]